jgi:hypothetical protein
MPETAEEKRRATTDVVRRAAIANAMSGTLGAAPAAALSAAQIRDMITLQHDARAGPRRTLRTVDAARYLGLSASLLRKYRAMGPGDPGMKGPIYIKVSANVVLYEISALDDWLDARRSAVA